MEINVSRETFLAKKCLNNGICLPEKWKSLMKNQQETNDKISV